MKKFNIGYTPVQTLADLTNCCNDNLDALLAIIERSNKALNKKINNRNLVIFVIGVSAFVEINAMRAIIKRLEKRVEELEEEKVVQEFMKDVEETDDLQ